MEDLPSQEQKISFEDLAESRGYSPKRTRRHDFNNVTHLLKAKGKNGKPLEIRFDVKKIKNKKQSQEWLWIEFKNAKGEDGWIHGDAHFVAFERMFHPPYDHNRGGSDDRIAWRARRHAVPSQLVGFPSWQL